MKRPYRSLERRLLSFAIAACACIWAAGCVSGNDSEPVSKPEEPAAALVETGETGEAEGGEWQVDESGRRYRVVEIPKVEGEYSWIGDDEIRVGYGMRYHVVDEDEDTFYVKHYAPIETASSTDSRKSDEEREAILAGYRVELDEVDRLRFQPFEAGLPGRGQWRNGFELADINADGHLDIVHGPPRKTFGGPVVFLGDGQGNWRRWEEMVVPQLPYDYGDVAVADFDQDGRLDLALAVHLRGMLVIVQERPGHFVRWKEGSGLDFQVTGQGGEDVGFTSRTIEAVDWNRDGRPDLVALGEGPRLRPAVTKEGEPSVGHQGARGLVVYLNQGDGTWARVARLENPFGKHIFGDDLAVGDLDGDGEPDALIATSVMGRDDLLRVSTGGELLEERLSGLRPGAYVRAVEVADFDGDGRNDLAVGYLAYELEAWRTGIDVFLGRPDGEWERVPLASQEGRAAIYALGAGDLEGDGTQDLVALTGDGEAWVFLGDGAGGFTRETGDEVLGSDQGCRGYEAELADLDGDGRDEVVLAFAGEPSAMFAPATCTSLGGLRAWDPQPRRGRSR